MMEIMLVSRKASSSVSSQTDLDLVKRASVQVVVLLDPALLLELEVMGMTRNVFAQLWLVIQPQPFLENTNLVTILHASVTFRSDDCNMLYMQMSLKSIWIL